MSADRCAISWTRQQNIKSDKSYELNTYHFDFDFYRVRRWQWDASPPTCSCRHLCCRPNRQSFALKYLDRIRKIVEFVRLSLCFRLPSNRWPILYPFFFVFVVFSLWAFEHFAAIAFPPVFFVYFFCLRGKSLYFQIVRSVSQWSGIHLLIQIKKNSKTNSQYVTRRCEYWVFECACVLYIFPCARANASCCSICLFSVIFSSLYSIYIRIRILI